MTGKTLAAAAAAAGVSEFVQQAEPEIVDAIKPQGQPNHRSSVVELERGTIEIRLWEMPLDHERDAVFRQKLLRKLRAGLRPAQPRNCLRKSMFTVPHSYVALSERSRAVARTCQHQALRT